MSETQRSGFWVQFDCEIVHDSREDSESAKVEQSLGGCRTLDGAKRKARNLLSEARKRDTAGYVFSNGTYASRVWTFAIRSYGQPRKIKGVLVWPKVKELGRFSCR